MPCDRVLLVDDEPLVLSGFRRGLDRLFSVTTATDPVEGLRLLEQEGEFAVVVADMQMPGIDGVRFLSEANKLCPDTVRIMLTGSQKQGTAIKAINTGNVFRFLTKPISTGMLIRNIREGIKRYHSVQEERNRAVEVAKQCEAAMAESRVKSEFLASMSHEIRTPMTSIMGYTDILLEENVNSTPVDRCESLHTIRRNGSHLLDIVNDILDLSKIEAGRVEVENIACDVRGIAEQLRSLFDIDAQKRGLRLSVQVAESVPVVVGVDPMRLRQILVNLIGNALKFTNKGDVRLEMQMSQSLETASGVEVAGRLICKVSDTGIGMSAEQVSRLFQAYSQADRSTSRKHGGTGLGLAISRQLAQLLGGDLTCQSELGGGSLFCLDIPVTEIADLDRARLGGPSDPDFACDELPSLELRGRRALVVEDGIDNQRLIAHLLRKEGMEVQVASNGQIGLQMLQNSLGGESAIDIVLMDMQMPIMSGYEAAALIRKSGVMTPVIALTANVMSGDRQKCLDAGCNDYAVKPIDRRTLIQQIARQLRALTSRAIKSSEPGIAVMPQAAC